MNQDIDPTHGAERASHADWMVHIEDGFYQRLRQVAAERGLPAEVATETRARVAEREREVAHLVANDLDRVNARFTMLAVALFDVVERRLARDAAIRLVDECLNQPIRPLFVEGTRQLLDGAPDPFAALVASSKEREESSFGPSFEFERVIDDAHGYVLRIRRCLFHELLRACARTELMPLLCRFDLNWADAIDPERHGFRFLRPSTFATADRCQMWFARTDGDVVVRLPVLGAP